MSSNTSTRPQHATVETLLAAAMRADAIVWRERQDARDRIVASRPVRRQNPQIMKAARPSLTVFEEPVSFGRVEP